MTKKTGAEMGLPLTGRSFYDLILNQFLENLVHFYGHVVSFNPQNQVQPEREEKMYISIRSVVAVVMGLMVLGIASSASADDPKWRVVTGSARSSVRCDEIGDVVVGGEDGKTPIYSCRNGEDWQAVKGSQAYTPRCKRMDHIWWSSENRIVMYTCTSGSVFIGNQPQPADGPWEFAQTLGSGELCSTRWGAYGQECQWRLVNKNHRTSRGYDAVRPRRFPDGVVEFAFEWAPPAPAVPASNQDSDVEVVRRAVDADPLAGREGDSVPSRWYGSPRMCISNCPRPAPAGMPAADPTDIPSGQPAAVSCGDEVVTQYLTADTKPVWIKRDGGSVRVCTGKTFGKSWQRTWDLVAYDDGTSSYFAGSADGNWRLVHGSVEAQAFGNIRWHQWVEVRGVAKRAYLATDKASETAAALYVMLDNTQLARVTKPVRLWRFVPTAGNFVYAVQE